MVIEIDGEKWHDENYDNMRDVIISKLGYKIIRIKSKENIIEKLESLNIL